jgi:hypothetical protein
MVMTYNFATAPLLTNPYNEFLVEGGKVWRGDRATATALDERARVGGTSCAVKVKNSAQPKALF